MRPRSPHLSRLLWSLGAGAMLSSLLALLGPLAPRSNQDERRCDWVTHIRCSLFTVYHDESPPPITPNVEISRIRSLTYRTNSLHPVILGFMNHSNGGDFVLIESGWPFRALMGWEKLSASLIWPDTSKGNLPPPRATLRTVQALDSHGLIRLQSDTIGPLPFAPLWIGLAANTLTWGAALFAIITLAATARAAARRRQGRCDRCGYDLQHTPRAQPCPECGGMHA